MVEQGLPESWIPGVRNRDEKAISAFIHASVPYLKKITYRFCPTPEDQEEWIDLILVHAIDLITRDKFQFTTREAFYAWFFKVATRKCIQYWRKLQRNPAHAVDHEMLDANPHPGAVSPADTMERSELRSLVRAAIDEIDNTNIKDTLQQTIHMGRSIAEIALASGKPLNTIRTWERRGRIMLREILERKHPEILEFYVKN